MTRLTTVAVLGLFARAYSTVCDPVSTAAGWEFAGPSTYVDRGDPLNISSAGAIQDVAFSGDYWFVGSVNGGVWRTTEKSFAEKVPQWTNVLDSQVCGVGGAASAVR